MKKGKQKVFFVGHLEYGFTCHSRMVAMQDLGYEIIPFSTFEFFQNYPTILKKFTYKFLAGPLLTILNRKLIKAAKEAKPDIVWVDKGTLLLPKTIKRMQKLLPHALFIHHNTDDIMLGQHNFKKTVLPSIPLFDVQVTSNTFNLEELKDLGAKQIVHMELAYNHHFHKPIPLTDADRRKWGVDVSYIGHWEPFTEAAILALREAGINVRILGGTWKMAQDETLKNDSSITYVKGEDYIKAISCSKINLCFLSKKNRNVTAARSFEIPATKSFLLAERTDAHLSYYKEGEEAEFFGNNEELVRKVKFYLANEEKRREVAEKGYHRCEKSGYSDYYRMQEVLRQINLTSEVATA